MSPGELIYFLLFGVALLAVILLIWLVFRKMKKLVILLTSMLVIGYAGYYAYFPTLKVITHAKRYEQLLDYLEREYPNKEFTIEPEKYEEGYTVGQFAVNDRLTPKIGTTLRVNKEGQVTQIGTWSKQEYPQRQDLWREIEFIYGEPYTLDKEKIEITKQDEWIEGKLTAFALTIDDTPSIALFTYSDGGYGLLDLQQGEREGFVFIEEEGYVFIYIDKSYEGEMVTFQLKNGEEYSLDTDRNKGKLIVENKF